MSSAAGYIKRAYCWGVPPVEKSPWLVPVVVIHHDRPGLKPADAVARAFERIGGVPSGHFAIADQPPQGGSPKHTYTEAFSGPLYGRHGLNYGPCSRLHEWMLAAFDAVSRAVTYRKPECVLLDWEGFYSTGPEWRSPRSVQHWASVRERAMLETVVAAANRTWGSTLDASNYEDRPHRHNDEDRNGNRHPRTAIGSTAAQVFYAAPRGMDIERVKADAARSLVTAEAAGVSSRPWLNEPELAEWVARFGVHEVIAWGSSKAPSEPLQEWVLRQSS